MFSSKLLSIILSILVLIGISACSSSAPAGGLAQQTVTTDARPDESFDPLTLEDDDITFPARSTGNLPVDPDVGTRVDPITSEQPELNRQVDGFRVQLFASKDIEKAMLEKKKAEFTFSEDSVAVYVEYSEPIHKVRLGDCRSRDVAESLRSVVRRKGYRDSFIVKTRINTHPILPHPVDMDSPTEESFR